MGMFSSGGLASALQPQTGGMLSRLLGTQAQSGIGQRLTDLLDPRVALPMAGALMGGRTFQSGLGDAMTMGGFGLGKLGETRKADAEKQRTRDYLTKAHPELAQMVDMGLPIEDAWKEALKLDHPDSDATSGIKEYEYAKRNGFKGSFMDYQNASKTAGGPAETGTTPQYYVKGRNPDGSPIYGIGVLDKAGGWNDVNTNGADLLGPYGTASDRAGGKIQGENAAVLPSRVAGVDDSIDMVDELLVHPSLNRAVGPMDGLLPSVSSGARDFDERVEQLKGRAFLQARQELKGGGQITDYEGKRAEAALVRASQSKNEADFKKAINEFRAALVRGKELLQQQAGVVPPTGGGGWTVEEQ